MRVLLVEDNARLAALVAEALGRAGCEVRTEALAASVEAALAEFRPDVLVLDLGLPDRDGLDLLADLRAVGCALPVLVLTARDALADRVRGLDGGADDYLVKPFAVEELLARLRALLRRPGRGPLLPLAAGNVTLDTATLEAWVAGTPLRLGRREALLLELLMRRANHVVAREAIETALGAGRAGPGSAAIEVLLHRLRRHLREAAADIDLHTLRGAGTLLQVRA